MKTFIGKENDYRKITLHWVHNKHPINQTQFKGFFWGEGVIESTLRNASIEFFSFFRSF
jgi:hypothetical protein